MSLQARFSPDDTRLYSIYRDVAHNFGDVIREAAKRLEDDEWAVLAAVLKKEGVTQEDLGRACEAYCIFVATSSDFPQEDMEAALVRSGFFAVPGLAQVALMAIIGTVLAGYYFAGVREATLGGKGPALQLQDLREMGARTSKAMCMPPWRRKLRSFFGRFARAWKTIRGHS